MNNVKTRFIIAISQKLAAAPDSAAKVDLIEELSENLCGRYADMAAAGMPEEEAYQKALNALGDVEELLAYLDGFGPHEVPPARDGGGSWNSDQWDFSGFSEAMREIMDQAKEAARDAKAIAEDAVNKIQEAIRNGEVQVYTGKSGRIVINDGGEAFVDNGNTVYSDDGDASFPQEGLRGVKVTVTGDVTVRVDSDPEAPVRVEGEPQQLQFTVSEDGILTIVQNKRTASGNFFFSRGLFSADVDITIPRRPWDILEISTTSGDVALDAGLEVADVDIHTASGDINASEALTNAHRLRVRTASGELEANNCMLDELHFTSASGDLNADGLCCALRAETASGDIGVTGSFPSIQCSTSSGDVCIHTEVFPQVLDISSKSGDCSAAIPDGTAFTLQFRTVSGDLTSDFDLTGPMGGRSGKATYMGGGEHTFHMASVSGDIELQRQH